MKTGTTVPYAVRRFKDHVGRFTRLYEDLSADRLDEGWLAELEGRDNLFPDLDLNAFRAGAGRTPALAAAGRN
jgi:1,4-alpha-glucan branching enzyme